MNPAVTGRQLDQGLAATVEWDERNYARRRVVEELSAHEVRALDRRACDVASLADVVAKTEGCEELVAPQPVSRYGRSKWAGEQLVARSGTRFAIARVQALYRAGVANFASKLRLELRGLDVMREWRAALDDYLREAQGTVA